MFPIPYRDLLQHQVAYAAEAARLFKEVVGQGRVSDEMLGKMAEIEHQGDNAAHMIIEQLNKVFITSFDREDIHALVMQVDDITDTRCPSALAAAVPDGSLPSSSSSVRVNPTNAQYPALGASALSQSTSIGFNGIT